MRTVASFALNLAAAVLIVLASVAIAMAGEDTCAGFGATIGGTCTPLTNTTSANNANTALGFGALMSNTTGERNTATGEEALFSNTTGFQNTATGESALLSNITGFQNIATGVNALVKNTTGFHNTATGVNALFSNTTGIQNTATGVEALVRNTTGGSNAATGEAALFFNTTGGNNAAIGANALLSNITGSSNIGIGANAGASLTTGDNNIDIGNEGVADESNTIRIGKPGTQTDTFIAGIFGGPTIKQGCSVVVDSSGQIGCAKSSARYKRDIHDMGRSSAALMKLRPVTFRYKDDPEGTKQYGLVAEEVERVYPELVIRGADGRGESVSYLMLTSMLLNEVQKQARDKDAQIAALRRQVASQQQQVNALKKKDALIDALAERMNALEWQARLKEK